MTTAITTEPIDLLTHTHPRNEQPRQCKFYLSKRAHLTLKNASRRTGLDMSAIVDALVVRSLPDDVPAHVARSYTRKKVNLID